MAFNVTILGSSSALPTPTRNLSAQLVNISESYMLIDCGEGTQMQLRKGKLKYQRIEHIFISHMHGDHYFGLIGLLSTMHMLGRTNELHIYAPAELKQVIDVQLKASEAGFRYRVHYHPHTYESGQILFEDDKFSVASIALDHRIPCCGFLFLEKEKPLKIVEAAIKQYEIPVVDRKGIKQGNDFTMENGKVIKNELITTPPAPPRSYAYCSDTAYNENIIDQIRGVDLLYHEATFMEDKLDRAKETYHSTAIQAATIAKKAGVKKLMLGHYSVRYKDLDPLLKEAQTVFPNTILANDGQQYEISNETG